MLENSIYSVISPDGCGNSWKDSSKVDLAAEGLRLTAQHRFEQDIMDKIIPEPPDSAHNDYDQTASFLDSALSERLLKYFRR